jgi:hypothetical protein
MERVNQVVILSGCAAAILPPRESQLADQALVGLAQDLHLAAQFGSVGSVRGVARGGIHFGVKQYALPWKPFGAGAEFVTGCDRIILAEAFHPLAQNKFGEKESFLTGGRGGFFGSLGLWWFTGR